MKKRVLTMLVATAVLGVTTAFAANLFSDVTPDSWAYQSVSQLAAAGIVNGYPDGTFKGQNNITRYEMAQMVAKAMANQDRANAEQQAVINRLADEFSAELNNLGVRVDNLENKVGNVKATGDVRLRFRGSDKDYAGNYAAYGKHSKFDMRGRVQFNATVNDKTSAVIRLTSGDMEFGDSQSGNARIDLAYVAHKFGNNVTGVAGRFPLTIGGGLMYNDPFDGVGVIAGNNYVNAVVGYGSMVGGVIRDNAKLDADHNTKVTLVQASVGDMAKNRNISGYYIFMNDSFNTGISALDNAGDIYGVFGNYQVEKVWIGGEWLKWKDVNDSHAWVAGIGYGDYSIGKKGTWDVKAQYFNQEKFAPIVNSIWTQAYNLKQTLAGQNGYKGWMATVDYALDINVGLSAYYGFDAKTQDGEDLVDFYRAELKYKF